MASLKSNNHSRALSELKQAANKEHALASLEIGALYMGFDGINRDLNAAEKYFTQAAKLGNATAMNNLVFLYTGSLDFNRNPEMALYWSTQAEKLGKGDYSLGYLYFYGFGVEQNYAKALDHFEKAVINDDRAYLANAMLVRIYAGGVGFGVDCEAAVEALKILKIYNEKNKKINIFRDIINEIRDYEYPCAAYVFSSL